MVDAAMPFSASAARKAGDRLGAGGERADAAGDAPDPKDREVGPVGLAGGWRLVLLGKCGGAVDVSGRQSGQRLDALDGEHRKGVH
jgi:hypothetical protein